MLSSISTSIASSSCRNLSSSCLSIPVMHHQISNRSSLLVHDRITSSSTTCMCTRSMSTDRKRNFLSSSSKPTSSMYHHSSVWPQSHASSFLPSSQFRLSSSSSHSPFLSSSHSAVVTSTTQQKRGKVNWSPFKLAYYEREFAYNCLAFAVPLTR